MPALVLSTPCRNRLGLRFQPSCTRSALSYLFKQTPDFFHSFSLTAPGMVFPRFCPLLLLQEKTLGSILLFAFWSSCYCSFTSQNCLLVFVPGCSWAAAMGQRKLPPSLPPSLYCSIYNRHYLFPSSDLPYL